MNPTRELVPDDRKSAIIGKAWLNGEPTKLIPATFVMPVDTEFVANQSFILDELTLRTDRNLAIPVLVKAGESLYFYKNIKRPGMRDADYSVSIKMPNIEADILIANSRLAAKAWREAHPVAQPA